MITQQIRRRLAQSKLRDFLAWYRHYDLKASDVFLASYPRSGSNWVKFLLLESIMARTFDFDHSDIFMPYVGAHKSAPIILPNGGRMIKTHEGYRREYQHAIYLIRDVRDVVFSEYRQRIALKLYNGSIDQFIHDFLEGKVSGLPSWQVHVSSWLEAISPQIMLIRFEDLRASPIDIIFKMLSFMHIEPDLIAVQNAVKNNIIECSRKKEDMARQSANSSGFFKQLKGAARFVNDGKVRGWVDRLSENQISTIEQRTGPLLIRLGYETHFTPSAG
jgi:hypothetical protein